MIKRNNKHKHAGLAGHSKHPMGVHDDLRRHFDAEIRLPIGASRAFLSAVIQSLIDNNVDFGLFHETDCIVIAHFGGDEIYLPSRWSDKRWHIGLEDRDRFDPTD